MVTERELKNMPSSCFAFLPLSCETRLCDTSCRMETLVGTSECRSDVSLLLRELLLLGATAADWHGLLSFITDTSKLAAFWEMSSVGLFSGVTGTTSVKTLFLVLFPRGDLEMLAAVSSAPRRQSCIGLFVARIALLVRMMLALHWSVFAAVCV